VKKVAMADDAENGTMIALRWTLGIVVAVESVLTAWNSYPEIHAGGHHGVHAWVRLVLGSVEAVGAILFLLPATLLVGGRTLLGVFAFAVLFHVLQGEFFMGNLLIYAAATVACMAHARATRT
jgi:hypothetical protein